MKLKFSFPGFVTSNARDLIRKILREPSKRCSLQNIKEHVWITKLIPETNINNENNSIQEKFKEEFKNYFNKNQIKNIDKNDNFEAQTKVC